MKFHYVYRITNTKLNKHYYGVRTSKIKPSNDIGFKYFSSSTDEDFMEDQKDNPTHYKYKVVSIFETRECALLMEIKLHAKFNVGINESFYNKCKQTSVGWDTTGTSFNLSEAAKNKISKALKGRIFSEEHRNNIGIAGLGRIHKTHSKKMMSINSSGDKNPMFNKKHSTESINKMKESSINPSDTIRQNLSNGWKKRKYMKCPTCGLSSNNKGNMVRWHFDNCRYIV
jgi:hypothetical protein